MKQRVYNYPGPDGCGVAYPTTEEHWVETSTGKPCSPPFNLESSDECIDSAIEIRLDFQIQAFEFKLAQLRALQAWLVSNEGRVPNFVRSHIAYALNSWKLPDIIV